MNYKDYKMVKLIDIATVERVKEGVVYPKDSVMIQVSATRGTMELLKEDKAVSTKYVIVKPKEEYEPYYLFSVIKRELPRFLEKYQTGINIQVEAFDHMVIPWHSFKTQIAIAKQLKFLDSAIEKEEDLIKKEQAVKKQMISSMFI